MKRAVKSKANAAVDKAIDPQKELEMAILELEDQHKAALKELLAYKTSAKQMEQAMDKQAKRAADLEKKAMLAIKVGDDELAKQCLAAKKAALVEKQKIERDKNEASGYAIELNRSRKQFETKLKMLKLKKGTMATQIAAARSGTGNAFGHDDSAFEKLAKAEERIDDEAIAAEVQAAMDGEELMADSELEAKLLAAAESDDGSVMGADDPLAQLKAKMAAEKERKKLPPGNE
ncbi:MAG: PspA/IM30 family protein [Deltaproteobacteria bacterium]|nr:PspA/IM30 family protein [Deltaproteobacteria bacterium]